MSLCGARAPRRTQLTIAPAVPAAREADLLALQIKRIDYVVKPP
jgi:hypothetical protein